MSQGSKDRTMIGTVAPITQNRAAQTTGAQHPKLPTSPGAPAAAAPASVPPGTPPMAATIAGPVMPSVPAPTLPPPGALPAGSDARPTVGMRPDGASAAAADPDFFVGQALGEYTIRRKLAEGGMGVVYEGEHRKIGKVGAIKVLKLELCRSEEVIERFHQEARAVNSIRHENIVDIYDFGRDGYGRVFFVMEYLEGEPLSSRIRRGAMAWPEALTILDQTLRALKAAHDKGFVHRDLKPDNIWLKYVDGRIQVKLLDFGIAKLMGTDNPREKLTQTGSIVGTPHYMSPEQINGSRDVDHRTDIYAMGVIMYEMFAGVTPFVGDTMMAVMTGHLFKEPPRLPEIPSNLGVPAPIAEIIDRMLVKDPAGRYDSVIDVLSDLFDVHRNQWPTHAGTLSQLRPIRPATQVIAPPVPGAAPAPRKRRTGAIVGGVAVVGLAIGGLALWKAQQEAPTPPPAVVTAPPGPKTQEPAKPTPPPALDPEALRKEAQLTLRASLRQTEPAVRVQGSDALGKIKDQPSIQPLTELTENDADLEVRGHAAGALGELKASTAAPLLAQLEKAAPPPLQVWYASALARLGDASATKRLLAYARSKDLAVAFKAGLTLAEVSRPGDKKAIAALRGLVAQEAKLNEQAPYAGALLLSKLAGLHDADARKLLYATLEHTDEGARLAAAEGLAKLGDDAGKKVLQEVMANQASPNRLVAAIAQIPLGEYGGLELITQQLEAREPDQRKLAARALGDIGEQKSLHALVALAKDKDWTVRIAASAAIVAIVGIDPLVLAQASVDWTKGALESQDWAVRKAAAGVLSDLPAKQAVPLLAQAILDKDKNVRLAASRSAGKIKTPEAAEKVALAVQNETDPAVKEQQVKALGEIGTVGKAAAHATLAKISEEPGRIGVLAAGSLIAVGDEAGKMKLDTAVVARQVELRLAAVQAASTANNKIVVPTLKTALADKLFDVKFAAAEGLAGYNAEKAVVVPVLKSGLDSKDAEVVGRAMASLTRLGETITNTLRTPAEMLDSPDPTQRLAAVPVVRAMPPSDSVPLLRRLVADQDQEVRHAGVEAIEAVVPKDKDQAIKLYKPLVNDPDPFVRSKAAGQLARIVPPIEPPKPQTAAIDPPAPPPPPQPPAVDATLPKVQAALDAAKTAASEATTTSDGFALLVTEVDAAVAKRSPDETLIAQVAELKATLSEAPAKLDALVAAVDAAVKAVSSEAGATPSLEAQKLIDEANALLSSTRKAVTAVRDKARAGAKKATVFGEEWTGDVQVLIASAETQIDVGNFAAAARNLAKADKLIHKQGGKNANLDHAYARLHDAKARGAADPAERRKLLSQAQAAYLRFAKTGAGSRVQRARARAGEIGEELKELGPE